MFAVPVLKPTFGILDWTIQEIRNFDIKTRKVLSMTGTLLTAIAVRRVYYLGICWKFKTAKFLFFIIVVYIQML